MAARAGCSPAQAVPAWHLDQGTVVLPKSVDPERLRENLGAASVELSHRDLAAIGRMRRRP